MAQLLSRLEQTTALRLDNSKFKDAITHLKNMALRETEKLKLAQSLLGHPETEDFAALLLRLDYDQRTESKRPYQEFLKGYELKFTEIQPEVSELRILNEGHTSETPQMGLLIQRQEVFDYVGMVTPNSNPEVAVGNIIAETIPRPMTNPIGQAYANTLKILTEFGWHPQGHYSRVSATLPPMEIVYMAFRGGSALIRVTLAYSVCPAEL